MDDLEGNETNYYRISVPRDENVVLTLTIYSGDIKYLVKLTFLNYKFR